MESILPPATGNVDKKNYNLLLVFEVILLFIIGTA